MATALVALVTACQQSRDWNGVFHRSEGWWYSDGGGSAELPGGETVWLFGDTWLRHNRHVLPNSMAIQQTPPGQAPGRGEIRFFARTERGHPLDVTRDGRRATGPWVASRGAETWLWPTSALYTDGRLVALYTEIGCERGVYPQCRQSLANMGLVGHSVVVVDDPTDDPASWRSRTEPLVDRRGEPPSARKLHWGSALLAEGGWLYVFGVGLGAKWVVDDIKLARVLTRDVTRYDLWQFLTPSGWRMVPTGPGPEDLQSLGPQGATELSVQQVVRPGHTDYVLVQTDSLTQEIIVRSARATEPAAIRWASANATDGARRFSLPLLDPQTAGGMSWAGRAHPHHSRDLDGLLVSYFSERTHSLRFVELPAAELPR